MCAHLCTRQPVHSVQPGHSEANEEASAMAIPSTLEGVRGSCVVLGVRGDELEEVKTTTKA